MPPSLPFPISGIVRDSRNNVLSNVSVTLIDVTQSSNPLVVTTDSTGLYVADAGNFNTGWANGDSVSVSAYNSARDEYGTVSFSISGSSKTQNLTLSVLASIIRANASGQTEPNIMVNVNNVPYTKENPFPIEETFYRKFLFYKILISYDSNNLAQYIGYAKPNSATSSAVWMIKKLDYNSNLQNTSTTWADGNTNEDNIWDNRDSISFS